MKACVYLIFSVLLLLAARPALADKGDTARGKKRPLTYSYTESMFAPANIWAQNGWQNMHPTDTTLNNFEIYTTHYQLGNTGLPYVPVVFNPRCSLWDSFTDKIMSVIIFMPILR